MAEIEFDQQGAAQPGSQPGSLQGYINIAGAVTSLTLIIGVGVWGYKLVRRDAAGVPVIMALKGPMRVAPDDPGGQIARNIGLAVNAVAADKPLPPPPSQVVLAPAPLQLTPSDQAPDATRGQASGPVGSPAAVVGAPSAAGTAEGQPSDAAQSQAQPAADAAPAQAPAPAPAAPAPTDPVEAALAAAQAATAAVMDGSGGSAQSGRASIRPVLRPAASPVAAAPAAPAPVKTVSVDPATLKPGTRLVQLGAYPSVDAAKDAWNRIATQFGQLMGDHGQVIQQAQSGGRVFYRLRAAGFDADSDARAFCAALQAQNAGCIPVTIR